MKYDSIEINGKDYRIEFNWNTVCNFIEKEKKTLADLEKLNELPPRQITCLLWCGMVEGCRLEGIDFPFTVDDFGAALTVNDIADIFNIYRRHTSVTSKVKAKKK
jgi:hypothetical protein